MTSMKAKLSTLALAVSLAVGAPMLSGCESTTSNSSTTNRSQVMLVSQQQVMQEAEQAYDQVLAEAKAANALNTNAAMTKRVKTIANKLIAKAPAFRADCKDWDWEVNVINSDQVNAWCMAGGKIAVYSAIITELDLTDGELATVLGHEIAHALREHTREQQSTEMVKEGAFQIASLFGVSDTAVNLGKAASNVAFTLPFSRSHENEADALGLELMYNAGYNPDEAVNLWTKMASLGSGNEGIAALLSTHPSDSDRIANLKKLSEQLKSGQKID